MLANPTAKWRFSKAFLTNIFGFNLSHEVERTSISTSDLPQTWRDELTEGITRDNLDEARAHVKYLRSENDKLHSTKDSGDSKDSGDASKGGPKDSSQRNDSSGTTGNSGSTNSKAERGQAMIMRRLRQLSLLLFSFLICGMAFFPAVRPHRQHHTHEFRGAAWPGRRTVAGVLGAGAAFPPYASQVIQPFAYCC